jgi:glycosyltransferase involved in cell wall biosynthesis
MRILLINYEFPPIGGGAANATFNIGKCLSSKGHDVFVLTSSFRNLKGWSHEQGMSVFRCRAIRKKRGQSSIIEMISYIISASLLLPRFIRKNSIEAMIVFFSFPCGPIGLLGNILCNTPYVVSLRGGDVPGNEERLSLLHKLLTPLRRFIFRNSKGIITNSEGLKELSFKADSYPAHVIPNGVDTDFYKPKKKKDSGAEKFLFVGRFQIQKNLFFLLEQMDKIVIEKGLRIELYLVGTGPLENSLKKFAKKLRIKDQIHWHGWSSMESIREHYQKADCLLNPSFCEGMPNVVLEAMACGIPVIASNVPGNNDIIRHEDTGFLFDLDKPIQLQEAIISLAANKHLISSMGDRGRNFVVEKYSWEKTANKYFKLIYKDE